MKSIYDYLHQRKFDHTKYKCYISEELIRMSLPIYSFDGRWVGHQDFNPTLEKKYRYFTRTSEQSIWGLETVDKDYRGVVYLTEAVFRSVALHRIGVPSMSLIGSTCSKDFAKKLKNHQHYDFVWIGDPDKSGKNMIKRLGSGYQSPKDLDEMNDEDLKKFIKEIEDGSITY